MAAKSTILIVDDEPLGRDTLEALLVREGYDLAFAASGVEALAQVGALKPDLILLDVMMPDMDGFEVCRCLRADPNLAEIPVVMVTALDDQDSRLRGIEAGADDFITKPFDRLELRARVRTITRLDRYRHLLAERTRLEWIVEQAAEGYLWVNAQDEIVYANPQAHLYLGIHSVEVEGRRLAFLDVARRQYRCEPESAWRTWPAQADMPDCPATYLVRPETPTATAFWLRVDVLDLARGLKDNRAIRLRDVTQEITRQIDMRGFHEALRHKIRTPFTGILGSLELLCKKGSQMPADVVAGLAQMAFDSAQRLHRAFEDILGYLNVHNMTESGRRFALAHLEALAAEVAASLNIRSLHVSCEESLQSVSLPLSQRAVELILWELLENAHKFHPEQSPTVSVSAFPVDDRRICLQVIDDGTHISPEHLSRVQVPYYQGEKYFTGEVQGMGLGLSTVARLIWSVGGVCRIQNRDDGPGISVELIVPV